MLTHPAPAAYEHAVMRFGQRCSAHSVVQEPCVKRPSTIHQSQLHMYSQPATPLAASPRNGLQQTAQIGALAELTA